MEYLAEGRWLLRKVSVPLAIVAWSDPIRYKIRSLLNSTASGPDHEVSLAARVYSRTCRRGIIGVVIGLTYIL